jgi:hypothetical protein
MIRRIAVVLLFLTMCALPLFAQSFTAQLTGAAEVPGPGDPDGTGVAVITIAGTTVHYMIQTQNIGGVVAAHIHRGTADVAGPAVVTFDPNMLASGSAPGIAQSLIDEIVANPGGFYVNVHTAEYPAGAVRGQLAVSGTGGARTLFFPAVGKVVGANNTNFVTDLRIVNTSDTVASVVLEYFAQAEAGQTSATATQIITVLPGEQRILDDVVGTTLGVESGLGGLRVTSDQHVIAIARVINDLRTVGLGTNGFSYNAAEASSMGGTLPFLISNVHFRTNLGYFNPSPNAVTATFTARRSSDGAVLGTRTVIIPGWSMLQNTAFGLISTVPGEEQIQDNYYVTWGSDAPLFVYGSVVDSQTGDSVVVQ